LDLAFLAIDGDKLTTEFLASRSVVM
jgi:hypothetical protein